MSYTGQCRFGGIVIAMYFGDHQAPHFHARYGDEDAPVGIDPVIVLEGDLPRPQRKEVLAWASERQEELMADWALVMANERPKPGTAEVRLLLVFDPDREAIVLAAGDKAGRWTAWYAEAIPLAEEQYIACRREADEEEE